MAISVNITSFMDTTSRILTEIYDSWRWPSISSNCSYVPEGCKITLQFLFL